MSTLKVVVAFTVIVVCLIFIFANTSKDKVDMIKTPSLLSNILPLSQGFNRPSSFMLAVYSKQVEERRNCLKQIKAAGKDAGWGFLYNNLAPEVYCAEKVKVGTTDDGGKWMCSPQKLPEGCVIFALGIANKITFERDIQAYTSQRCRIISVDSGKQEADVIRSVEAIGGVVVQAKIGPKDDDKTRTMESILQDNGAKEVEILKIDIEGAELSSMEPFLNKFQPAQIMIEVHGTPAQTVDFLQMVASKGYYLAHYEINGRYHQLAEYVFVHENYLENYGATLMATYLRPRFDS